MKAISNRTLAISCLQACAVGVGIGYMAVSYTHLTLPTILLV